MLDNESQEEDNLESNIPNGKFEEVISNTQRKKLRQHNQKNGRKVSYQTRSKAIESNLSKCSQVSPEL